jgi:hypothetical protein
VGCGKFPEVCYPSSDAVEPSLILVGNFYSIENDYDQPARIFFAQGCEVEDELPGRH